jgi:hypothetical protein
MWPNLKPFFLLSSNVFIIKCLHLIVVFGLNGLNMPKCHIGYPGRNRNYSVSYEIMSPNHLWNVYLVITSHVFILNRLFAIDD